MIAHLSGEVAQKSATQLVLDVQGVGYELNVPLSTSQNVPEVGGHIKLLTYQHVREDSLQLFGFCTAREKWMFAQLISVSGIGPKLAIAVLSGCSIDDLARAIIDGDVTRLSHLPGIGRKTAQRLNLELREKLQKGIGLGEADVAPGQGDASGKFEEAILALVSLGYGRAEAERSVSKVLSDDPDLSLDELIRKALQKASN